MRNTRKNRPARNALRRKLGDESGFGMVEVLIAAVVGLIGLLAVSSLQLAAATQGRIAQWRTGQALAAQQVFEQIVDGGYTAAASGSFAPMVDGRTYRVTVTVTQPALRVKRVLAQVAGVGSVGVQTYVTRIYEPRAFPPTP